MGSRSKYVGINLPDDLIDRIDELIKEGRFGYRSRAEFVKEAIREKITRIKELERSR